MNIVTASLVKIVKPGLSLYILSVQDYTSSFLRYLGLKSLGISRALGRRANSGFQGHILIMSDALLKFFLAHFDISEIRMDYAHWMCTLSVVFFFLDKLLLNQWHLL